MAVEQKPEWFEAYQEAQNQACKERPNPRNPYDKHRDEERHDGWKTGWGAAQKGQ